MTADVRCTTASNVLKLILQGGPLNYTTQSLCLPPNVQFSACSKFQCSPWEAYSIVRSVVYPLPWQPPIILHYIYTYIAPAAYFVNAV